MTVKTCDENCPLREPYSPHITISPIPAATEEVGDQSALATKLYTPIKEWQTRILIFRNDDRQLRADLVVVDLVHMEGVVAHESQQQFDYVAVSYTWGGPQYTRHIIVNDVVYPITENLYGFLQQYRRMESTFPRLWIDAICINQHDASEKAVQVANMLSIYKKARRVVAWLGDPAQHSRYAIRYLEWWQWDEIEHSPQCVVNLPHLLDGLVDLYGRPWVRRAWVRQEVWAAKTLTLLCGDQRIRWPDFREGINAVAQISHQVGDKTSRQERRDPVGSETIKAIEELRRRRYGELAEHKGDELRYPWIGRDDDDIVTVLRRSSACLSSDPRDRVYALLGMCRIDKRSSARDPTAVVDPEDNVDLDLRVDYTRPVHLVFQDVARYVMRRERCVSAILCLSARFGGRVGVEKESLPSWTPDWRYATTYEPWLYFDFSMRGERKELLDSDDDSEAGNNDGWEEVDELTSPVDDETQPIEGLQLTSDVRVPVFNYDGPVEHDSGILELRGYIIADLVEDLPHGTGVYKPKLKHRGKSVFAKAPNLMRQAQEMFSAMKSVEIGHRRSQLRKNGQILVHVPLKKRGKKAVVLRDKDIEFQQVTRDVVPVKSSIHFRDYNKRNLWDACKYMKCQRRGSIQVPLSRFLRSNLGISFAQKDTKRAAERKDRRGSSDDEDADLDVGSTYSSSTSSLASDLDGQEEQKYYDNVSSDDSDDERDSDFDDYTLEELNQIFNEHFPDEFAVPPTSQKGDVVVVVVGCALPLVLRPVVESQGLIERWTFVGPAALTDALYNPRAQTSRGYDLWDFHRPQKAVYGHLQIFLNMQLRARQDTVFNVV